MLLYSEIFRSAHQIAGRYAVIDVPATVSSAVFGDFIFLTVKNGAMT